MRAGFQHRYNPPAQSRSPLPIFKNHLLSLLPAGERKALAAQGEPVPLVLGDETYSPGGVTRHVYFPEDGYLSLISNQPDTPKVEVGMVGREGFVGSQLVLGVSRAPWRVVVQGAGSATRVPAAAFGKFLDSSPALQSILKRYVATLMAQFAIAAPCLSFHKLSPRLARWLLMTQDRAGMPEFKATHEYLSYMLGVRRAGVTEAAGDLQRIGAIHYERGMVTVIDRAGLEAAACTCYAADCLSYESAMNARQR